MRLIDADALIDEIDEEIEYGTEKYEKHFDDADKYITKGLRIARKDILKQPTIDAALVKHGKWMGTVCTACGESDSLYFNHDFCPNCGARMDKEAEK